MSIDEEKYFLIEYEHGAGQAYSVSSRIYSSRAVASIDSRSSIGCYSPYLTISVRGFPTYEDALAYQKKHHIYSPFSL